MMPPPLHPNKGRQVIFSQVLQIQVVDRQTIQIGASPGSQDGHGRRQLAFGQVLGAEGLVNQLPCAADELQVGVASLQIGLALGQGLGVGDQGVNLGKVGLRVV